MKSNKIILLLLALVIVGFAGYKATGASEQINSRLIVLCYHHLAGEGEETGGSTLSVTDFARHMAYLHEHNYNVLGLEEFLYHYEQRSFPEKSVMITFDDGYQSFYTLAYPILKEYNYKAVLFPVVGLTPGLERRVVWNRHLTFHEMRLMLKDSKLVHIGSHTYDLHYYRDDGKAAVERMKDENEEEYIARIEQDLRASKDLLELQTDQTVLALAWPYGRTNRTAVDIAKNLDYKLLFVLGSKPVTPRTSLDQIPRYGIQSGSIEELQKILAQGGAI